ncbi:MAG: DNA polymerase/3'-5' exonuclease PolX [Acidobacteria bacterium]|nr:MAG: DNA polymerase/3'-5' exonuclease PolX [Acidobacteriota bacterium]
MDNHAIARVLGEIADLLEIKGENPFKIRAYRAAADTVADSGQAVAALDEAGLRALPGIGKDLAARILELTSTGLVLYHQELLAQFPVTMLDLLRLQGVGPKTAALLYRSLQVASLDELEQAARSGRLRSLKGMGPRKEALILKALEERRQHAGRHLLPDTHDLAAALLAHLREASPGTEFIPVGSLRRGVDTCGDLDVLAIGGEPSLIETFTRYRLVERVLGRGDTKGSVLIRGGYQADLRLVPPDSRGAAMQYFTGSKAHNIALRDRAIARGLKLNEYGLFDLATGLPVAGDTEEGIYQALGLAFVPPELREHRGEIEAAERGTLPRLIERADIRGDLHCHTDATDGRDGIEAMAAAARDAGHEYLAITDHSQALAMSGGLDEARALEHARRVRAIDARMDGIRLLAGIECDIRADGTPDLAADCLAQLDLVIASVHSAFHQDEAQMTARVLRAMDCPWVDVLGHPSGRLLLKRQAVALDMARVIAAAAEHGMALEINSQVDRLDLNDMHARLARVRGVPLVIDTDSHSTGGFGMMRWGVTVARRAWLEAGDVLNTRPLEGLRAGLRRNRNT